MAIGKRKYGPQNIMRMLYLQNVEFCRWFSENKRTMFSSRLHTQVHECRCKYRVPSTDIFPSNLGYNVAIYCVLLHNAIIYNLLLCFELLAIWNKPLHHAPLNSQNYCTLVTLPAFNSALFPSQAIQLTLPTRSMVSDSHRRLHAVNEEEINNLLDTVDSKNTFLNR